MCIYVCLYMCIYVYICINILYVCVFVCITFNDHDQKFTVVHEQLIDHVDGVTGQRHWSGKQRSGSRGTVQLRCCLAIYRTVTWFPGRDRIKVCQAIDYITWHIWHRSFWQSWVH